MHCDDKRTLFVLKEEIKKSWKGLEESDFKKQELLEKLNDAFLSYFDYKYDLDNQENQNSAEKQS